MASSSAYSLEFVLCKSTGEPLGTVLDAKARKMSFRLNVPGTATLTLPIFNSFLPSIIPGESRLKVYRSATAFERITNPAAPKQMIFYGSLPAENYKDDTEEAELIFRDPRWVWESRYLAVLASFTAADQGTILASVVNTENTKGNTWLTAGGVVGGLRTVTWDAGKKVADIVKELTETSGGMDVSVTPVDGWVTGPLTRAMGSLAFVLLQGTDKPNVMFYYKQQADGHGDGNIIKPGRSFAPLITRATEAGTDGLGVFTANVVTGGSGGADVLESYVTESDAFDSTMLSQLANGTIVENATLRPAWSTGGATWDAPQPFTDYVLGDTVRLSVSRGPIQLDRAVVRVHGFDLEADAEGNVRTEPLLVNQ